jgi:cytidylate kinase
MAITNDRVYESLALLNRYLEWQDYPERDKRSAQEAATGAPITIAVSRQAGSGGLEIARAVGLKLGWPVYDHELLDRIAEEKGLNKRLVEYLDERCPGWLEQAIRSFANTEASPEGSYLRGLMTLLTSLSKAGHCVIVGRGAAQALPPETTLSVRVVAPRADRITAVQKRAQLSAADAERWVDSHDRERLRFVERYFCPTANDPVFYDLVLNTRRISVDECAALIVQAALTLEAKRPVRPAA